MFLKLTNESGLHNGYQFQEGVNTDSQEWNPNDKKSGFNFTDDKNWPVWILYSGKQMTYVWDVEIIGDQHISFHTKHKAHCIKLSNRRPIISLLDTKEKQIAAIQINPWVIKFIKTPVEEVQKEAVRRNGLTLLYIDNPSDAIQIAAVTRHLDARNYIMNPSEDVQAAIASKASRDDQLVKNLEIVRNNGLDICKIHNPSWRVCMTAVEQNGLAIKYIQKPFLDIQRTAVTQNGLAIEFIANPSDAIQIAALNQTFEARKFILNPSVIVQYAILEKEHFGWNYELLKKASYEVQKIAIEKNWRLVAILDNPPIEFQLIAVRQDGFSLGPFDTEEVRLAAVRQNGLAVARIRTPSIQVQMAAVQQNRLALRYIENVTRDVRMAARHA